MPSRVTDRRTFFDARIEPGPVAFAGWLGLLVTALNLLPVGQLDAGHIAYALGGRRRARAVSQFILGALVIWGLLTTAQLVTWAVLIWFIAGTDHPPARDELTPLDARRSSWQRVGTRSCSSIRKHPGRSRAVAGCRWRPPAGAAIQTTARIVALRPGGVATRAGDPNWLRPEWPVCAMGADAQFALLGGLDYALLGDAAGLADPATRRSFMKMRSGSLHARLSAGAIACVVVFQRTRRA